MTNNKLDCFYFEILADLLKELRYSSSEFAGPFIADFCIRKDFNVSYIQSILEKVAPMLLAISEACCVL